MSQEGPLDPGIGEEGAGGMVAGCGGVEAILAPNGLGNSKLQWKWTKLVEKLS